VTTAPLVLVVDDSPIIVRAATLVLSRAGYDVRAAETAADGLRQAQALRPRVILLDVELPDGDGHDVLRQLKADPATASIPVIFCTGHKDGVADAEAYLAKPFSPSDLLAVVERFVVAG
jgi:CheY-like chemotaxis protein